MHRIHLLLTLAALTLCLVAIASPSQAAPTSNLRVSFINVGQGDSILLHDDTNFDMLVDGGQPSAGPTVAAYLRQEGIDDVDVMVSTHADSDHSGGLIDVLQMNDIPVQAVYYNGYAGTTATWSNFVTAVGNEGVALTPLQYPSTFNWGTLNVSVLGPVSGLSSPEQNDASVVLLVQHGSVKYLLTGDISSTAEAAVLTRGIPVADSVLKVAHHGSAYSSSSTFLSSALPSEAIISVGPNSYGHPSPDTISRLQAAGARVWRTDQSGTIVVTDNGSIYQMPALIATHFLYLPFTQKSDPPPPTWTPVPPATNTPIADGSPPNPWGYNFTCCTYIYTPPSNFCSYFACIPSFWNGTGYVMQCKDGMYSKSGGSSGSCSYHGGNNRPLYAP